jgi:ribosomal protein S12
MPTQYQPILDIKTTNPNLTWSQAAKQAGFEGKWTSNGKGGVKPRTGNRNQQNQTRAKGERTYTTEEAQNNAASLRKQARKLTQTALHQYVHGNKHTIGEHNRDIASGGIGDDLNSISDPYFKEFKDNVAQKVRNKYGDKYIVDINDITGFLRVIPSSHYNQYQNRSQQPGFDVEPDMDLNKVVSSLPFIVAEDLGISQTSFPGLPSLITEGLRTPPQTKLTPQSLAGFPEMPEMGPTTSAPPTKSTSAPPTKYVPPVVMQYSYDTYTNGNGNGNGDHNGSGKNGGPPTNGGGYSNGGSDFVDGLTSAVSVGAAVGTAVVGGLMSLPGALTTSGI